jgi:hypothetical protein
MKNINEAFPTLGGIAGTTATGSQQDPLAAATTAYNAAIKANAALVAAGKPADPKYTKAAQDALTKLQKAAQDAGKKLSVTPQPSTIGTQTPTTGTQTVKAPGQADEEIEEGEINNSMAKSKLSPAQKKIASKAAPKDKITGADFKALKKESIEISNFLKAISQKNYAQADKYLQSAVESKLKASISKAIETSK